MSTTIELKNRIPVMLRPTEQRINALAAILKRHLKGEEPWVIDIKAERLALELIATRDIQALLWDLGKPPSDLDVRREIAAEIETEVLASQKAQEERELDAQIEALFSPRKAQAH